MPSKRGGKSSGSGTKRRATAQGGTKAQKAAAGRKGGRKSGWPSRNALRGWRVGNVGSRKP